MNRTENLERDLTMWLADTATPRVPDFTDDILWVTARTQQRPRWSFAQRWLPGSLVTFSRRTLRPLPWRTLGLLAALALLLAAAAFYVGSQPRWPPPVGLAATGLVAYASGGDIYTVDPITGMHDAIVTGPTSDREPRWSLDGTRLAFLRSAVFGEALVIVDRQSREVIAMTDPFTEVDDDSIAWSPDGRSIAAAGTQAGVRALFVVDATTGLVTALPIEYAYLEAYWRPPDGRQLLFLGGTEADSGLFMVDIDDGTVTALAAAHPGETIRPSGWTPDGRRVVFTSMDDAGFRTQVLDVRTGSEVTFDRVGFAHVSNDGRRMLALDGAGRPCVAWLSGGPCSSIGQPWQAYDGTHAAGAHWSPDDEWILIRDPASGGEGILLDPDGQTAERPSWIALGAESIQRVAP
jgi:Tol biopolymer transport system component